MKRFFYPADMIEAEVFDIINNCGHGYQTYIEDCLVLIKYLKYLSWQACDTDLSASLLATPMATIAVTGSAAVS